MNIKDFNVMVNPLNLNERRYFYGELDEFDLSEIGNFVKIPYEEWTSKDFSTIFGNIIEDRNHHWMTDIPEILLDIMKQSRIPDIDKTFIMKNFAERIEKEKFSR